MNNRRGLSVLAVGLCALAIQAQTVIAPRNTTVIAPARPTLPAGTIAPATPRPATPVAGTAQPAPGAAATHSIKTERLICRGGELRFESYPGAAPIPNANPGTELLGVIFSTPVDARGQPVAAGRSGGGLEPGTCAFESRPWAGEAPAVNYQTIAENAALARSYTGGDYPPASKRADARSIPEWLRNPANYWRFEVYDSRRGYLVALDHGPWQPEITAATALTDAGKPKPDLEVGRVTNLKATPLVGGVRIDFSAPEGCSRGTTGHGCHQPGANTYYVLISSAASGKSGVRLGATMIGRNQWSAATTEAGQRTRLKQGERYHYTVVHDKYVSDGGRVHPQKAGEHRGSFRTLTSGVTVRIDSIDLLRFNPGVADDLEIRIEVNPKEPGKGGAREISGLVPALRTFQIGEEIPVIGVDRVRLLVTVIVSSRKERARCYETRRPAENGERYFDTIQGYQDACIVVGVAKHVLDLTAPEFDNQNAHRTLEMGGGNLDGEHLSFVVYGSVTQTRPH